jgi:hypothetical protein
VVDQIKREGKLGGITRPALNVWETSSGQGKPNYSLFPIRRFLHFESQLDRCHIFLFPFKMGAECHSIRC